MKYKIIISDKANDQLNDIISYIAGETQSTDIALSYLDNLEESILNLGEFPYLGIKPRYSIIRKQGYLVLIVDKHLVFYKVNDTERIVTIYTVVDGRQEYKRLI